MTPHPLSPLYALVLGLALSGAALAEKADRDQPMNAEADSLRYDDARQVSVFTGNVVITKGTIVIRGAQVEVRQEPQGRQLGTVLGSASAPAFFRQKREGVDEFIEGTAQRIEYDSEADTVRFVGQALLRRFKGSVLNDETAGNVIVYNNLTSVFTVNGAQPQPTAANPSGRVRAMLTPTPKATPAGAANPPVGAPGAAGPATLRSSPALEDKR